MKNRIISCGGFRRGQRPPKEEEIKEEAIESFDPQNYDPKTDRAIDENVTPEEEQLQIAEYIEPIVNRTEGLSGDFRHDMFDSEFEEEFYGEYVEDNWSEILMNDEYLREISNELRNLESMNPQTMGAQSLKLRMDIKKFLHQMRLVSSEIHKASNPLNQLLYNQLLTLPQNS